MGNAEGRGKKKKADFWVRKTAERGERRVIRGGGKNGDLRGIR